MLSTLSAMLIFGSAYGYSGCDEDDLGKIVLSPTQMAGVAWDTYEVYPNAPTFELLSGRHSTLPDINSTHSWNNAFEGVTVIYGFVCMFYDGSNFNNCLGTIPKRSNQNREKGYIWSPWTGSWNDITSSYKCGRLCTTKQAMCKDHDWSKCGTLDIVACEECVDGYITDKYGICYNPDPKCVAVEVEITSFGEPVPAPFPESVEVDYIKVDNCGGTTPTGAGTTYTTSVTKKHIATYTRTKSWSETFSHSTATQVGVTYSMGFEAFGFSSGLEISASTSSESGFSHDESSSQTTSDSETYQTVDTWSTSFEFTAEPYNTKYYTKMGYQHDATLDFEAVATCILEDGIAGGESVEFSGTFTSAVIHDTWVKTSSVECGADDSFDKHDNTQCTVWYIEPVFDTLMEAQQYCTDVQDYTCAGVYDEFCDGKLGYRICADASASPIASIEVSEAGSCVWTKKSGDGGTGIRRRLSEPDAEVMVAAGLLKADQTIAIDAEGNIVEDHRTTQENEDSEATQTRRLVRLMNGKLNHLIPSRN